MDDRRSAAHAHAARWALAPVRLAWIGWTTIALGCGECGLGMVSLSGVTPPFSHRGSDFGGTDHGGQPPRTGAGDAVRGGQLVLGGSGLRSRDGSRATIGPASRGLRDRDSGTTAQPALIHPTTQSDHGADAGARGMPQV